MCDTDQHPHPGDADDRPALDAEDERLLDLAQALIDRIRGRAAA